MVRACLGRQRPGAHRYAPEFSGACGPHARAPEARAAFPLASVAGRHVGRGTLAGTLPALLLDPLAILPPVALPMARAAGGRASNAAYGCWPMLPESGKVSVTSIRSPARTSTCFCTVTALPSRMTSALSV